MENGLQNARTRHFGVGRCHPAAHRLPKGLGIGASGPALSGLAVQVAMFHTEPVALLTALIGQAKAEGDLLPDVPAEQLAQLLFAAVVGIDELAGPASRVEQMTQELIDLFVRAMGTSRREAPAVP